VSTVVDSATPAQLVSVCVNAPTMAHNLKVLSSCSRCLDRPFFVPRMVVKANY